MRRQSLLLAITVAAAGVHASSPAQREEAAGQQAPQIETDGGEDTSQASPAPAAGFTPTEKIEADSAVSFPVDI
jgi:hypothetical protein